MKHFDVAIIPPDVRRRMQRSYAHALTMRRRELHCPYCGFTVACVYANTAGHYDAKCQKCKAVIVYSLTPGTDMDFRRAKAE